MAAQALDHGNVADAEPKNEPVAIERVQRDHGALRGEGIARIDVGDRTADHQLLAARQQKGRQRHRLIAPRFRVPQVRVAIISTVRTKWRSCGPSSLSVLYHTPR